jgi:phage shock protein PspC (stress-responsive transcriptional regulator)
MDEHAALVALACVIVIFAAIGIGIAVYACAAVLVESAKAGRYMFKPPYRPPD